jgi:2-dehydropantoate 2-reductase
VRAQGLRLIEPRQEHVVHRGLSVVAGVSEASALGPFDLALLTVKAYDVATAASEMQEVGLGHPPVVCLQNGIGSEERLSQTFGPDRVIAASLTQPVSVPEPGVVRLVKTRGGIALAPVVREANVTHVASVLEKAGLNTRVYRNYRVVKWSKLPLNILGNTIPAILDMPPGEVYAHPGLLQVEVAAMRELTAVTQALGVRIVNLPGYPARPLMWALGHLPTPLLSPLLHRLVGGGRKGRMPSLLRGLTQARTVSEVTDLNGAVVRYGARAGVPTSINRLLTETLEAIYAGGADAWSEWRHRPERLVEAYKASVAPG